MKRYLLILLCIPLLNCSSIYGNEGVIRNRDTEYLRAQNLPPLKIPPNLSSSTVETRYPVPEKNYPENTKKVSLIPPGL